MQARMDGELSPSEAVVFEQHLSECARCAHAFQQHQRVTALLFETLHDDRLHRSLRQSVLDNLPEMDASESADLATLNWRAKHPRSPWVRRLPLVVAVLLTVLGVVIRFYWPVAEEPGANVIGLVTYRNGVAYSGAFEQPFQEDAPVKTFVAPEARFETGADSQLMLSLLGPTQLKMNENTRITVHSERSLTVESGQVWLDVGRTGRRFEVQTAAGHIAVLGTEFLVQASPTETEVTVFSGEVHLDSVYPGAEFVVLRSGDRSRVRLGHGPSQPEAGMAEVAWAEAMVPDRSAYALFVTALLPRSNAQELPAQKVHWVPTYQDGQRWSILGLRLAWDALPPGPYCSFDVYVYDERMQPLFRDRIDGTVFGQDGTTHLEIMAPTGPISQVNALIIRLTPDYRTGTTEPRLNVKALGS